MNAMTAASSIAAPVARPFIAFEQASVTFGRGEKAVQALQPTDLTIAEGDFVALVGPSGCGKSTILKMVSELLKPSSGYVFIGGREIGANPIRIGMAYQNPTLLPWLNIRDNVMLPLKIEELWAIMQDLWLSKKLTVLLVTHDLREAAYLANRICVMSARPGRILDDSPVEMPRPRTIEMTFQPDFVALNQRLRAMIVGARGGTGIVNHPPGQG